MVNFMGMYPHEQALLAVMLDDSGVVAEITSQGLKPLCACCQIASGVGKKCWDETVSELRRTHAGRKLVILTKPPPAENFETMPGAAAM